MQGAVGTQAVRRVVGIKPRVPYWTEKLQVLLIHMEADVAPTLLLKTKLIHVNKQSCSFRQNSEGVTTERSFSKALACLVFA